jgi:CheY-like chemotaxis protein
MSTLKAVIAEDEGNLREQLRETLGAVWPELEICAEAGDGIEAMRAIERHSPDVLFLDIQMPGMTGLEVARHASGRCHVVFVTAYDKYAVSAFEQGAIDYVMKPLSAARLADSVKRLRERASSAPAPARRAFCRRSPAASTAPGSSTCAGSRPRRAPRRASSRWRDPLFQARQQVHRPVVTGGPGVPDPHRDPRPRPPARPRGVLAGPPGGPWST